MAGFLTVVWMLLFAAGDTSPLVVESYGEWACRQANERYAGRADSVAVYRLLQSTPLDGSRDEPGKHLTLQQDCRSGPSPETGRFSWLPEERSPRPDDSNSNTDTTDR
ncbi:MAG: hypothetical protein ACOCY1_04215 [Halovenus sp.]